MTDEGPEPDDEEPRIEADARLQAGLDHLQRAAKEVIAASRALLDVAEDLVDDPHAATGLTDMLASFGALAGRMGRAAAGSAVGHRDEDDDDGDPPVQRIPVS